VPFLHVTTRIEGRKHDELMFDLGGTGFPWIVYLNRKGEVVGKLGEDRSVKGFAETAAKVARWLALEPKAQAGDAAARTDVALLRCAVGVLDFDELEEQLEGVELTPAQARQVKLLRVNATVGETVTVLRQSGFSEDARESALEEFLAIYGAGTHPTSNRWWYWDLLRRHAIAERDARLLEGCLGGFREMFKGSEDPRVKPFLEKLEQQLAEFKAGSE
jgi:hypothetical protein